MASTYLGLGSNLGDPRVNIRAAIARLRACGSVEAVSSLYQTEPVGFADQPWFLNCVVAVETELSPEDLLAAAKQIEHDLGRTPGSLNGPRPIDIDILLYAGEVVTAGPLVVPHPRLHERRFVLEPLSEIAPDAMHPLLRATVSELLAQLHDPHRSDRLPAEDGFPLLLHC